MNRSFDISFESGVDVAASPKAKGEWRAAEERCVVGEKELENPECEYMEATQTCGATCGNVDENSHPREVNREY